MFTCLIRQGIILYFFLCWTVFWKTAAINPLLLAPALDHSMAMILKQFVKFDFVVHVDESKLHILAALEYEQPTNPVTIFKYTANENKFHRPLVHKCVHYVAQEDYSAFLDHYSSVSGNVEARDVIMFLNKTLDMEGNFTIFYNTGVDNANMVFYLNATLAYAILFYNSPTTAATMKPVPRSKNNDPLFNLTHNTFKNFQGFPMKVGYTNCKPFVYREKRDGYLIGVEFKIMEMVISLLNFTPQYEDYSNRINGRSELVKDVNQSKLHCAIGCLSNTVSRNKKVSFSTMLQYEPHIVLYSSLDRYGVMSIYAVFQPLRQYVWMCCIATLIFVSISVKLLMWSGGKHATVNSVLLTLSILLEQSSVAIPRRSHALRFGLITWLLVGFVLSSSYKSKLTAVLITPVSKEPTQLSELISEHYHFISPATDSTFLLEILKMSNDDYERFVGNEIEDTKDVCEALLRSTNEIAAVVEEQTVLRYLMWNECKWNLSVNQIHAMRRLERSISVNAHGWIVSKTAPYRERLSDVLEQIKSAGLIQKWYNSYNITRPIAAPHTVKERKAAVRLAFHDLVAVFLVLFFGCFIATAAFFIEFFVSCVDRSHTVHAATPVLTRMHFA